MSQPAAIESASRLRRDIPEADLPRLRRRALWSLFIISAFGSTGYIAAITVGTLVAADLSGGPTLGGVPTATATVGTASAASLISLFMLRVGRRRGLLLGLLGGVSGGVIVFLSVLVGSIPLLLIGSFFTGFANGSGNLGRYIAADMVEPSRRASAIGTVVWGTTIGAVSGPNIVAPAGDVARSLGLPELAGAYGVTIIFLALAWLLTAWLLRPEPYAIAHPSALASHDEATGPAPSLGQILSYPSVLVALVSLAGSQVVMVLIMTMTPLHLTSHGHGLETVGFVLSAHTFGMFALSPISGRLADRFGSPPVIAGGLATLATAALLAATAPPSGDLLLTLALFLLGFGWSLSFVAASSLLTRGLAIGERTRIQGIADALTWGTAAIASLSSGMIVAGASYTVLGLLGAMLVLVPAAMLLVHGRAVWRASVA